MGTKTFNNYEDLLTFTRASKGHALRPVSYGDELVTNGTFTDNIDGWQASSANATLSHSTDALQVVATGGGVGAVLTSAITVEVGKIYTVEVESTSATGRHQVRVGNSSATSSEYFASDIVDGVATEFRTTFVATKTALYVYLRNDNAGTTKWDNVSVKEVTFDQPDGTLTLFEHPNNVPRVEWDADGNRLGLIVEDDRTNEVTHSEDFGIFWQKVASGVGTTPVVTADYAPAPYSANGRASRLQASKTSGAGYSLLQVALGNYTGDSSGSLWVKSNTGANQTVYFRSGSIGAEEKTVTTEWTRLETSVTLSAGQIYLSIGSRDNVGSEDIDILIWGAQLEKNGFVTSYIKTEGATATRSADVASIPVADFGYNQSAFTVLIEAAYYSDSFPSYNRFWELGGGGDSVGLFGNAGTSTYVSMTVGGVSQITFSDSAEDVPSPKTFMKYGIGLATDNFDIARDGTLDAGDTSITMPDAISSLNIGSASNNTTQLNGYIKSIKYYPRRLTNAQLQALTEPRSTPTLSLTFDGLESSYTENYIHG